MDVRSKKTPLFLAKDLELAFFKTAPAHEIIKYVDLATRYQLTRDDRKRIPFFDWTGKYWQCSKEIETALASRNDPDIDIALVRIGDSLVDDTISKYLNENESDNNIDAKKTHHLSKLILSAVQNKASLSSLANQMSSCLKKAWSWMIKNGDSEHYDALFSNPNIPDELIENILKGIYDETVSNKFWMYGYAMKCPVTRRGLDDQKYGPDFAAIRRLEAYWNFIAKLNTEDDALRRSIAENFENFPWRIELEESDYGFPKYGDPDYNRDDNLISYVEIILTNWLSKASVESNDYESRCIVVEFVCSTVVNNTYSDKVLNYIKNHDLLPVRKGFYRAKRFRDNSIQELESYAAKDGYEFLWSAIYNRSLYNFRDSKELCFWFFKKISYARLDKTLEGKYDENLQMDLVYKNKMNSIHKDGKKIPSLETLNFENFEKKFYEWKDGKKGAFTDLDNTPVISKKVKPKIPTYDRTRRISGSFKLKYISVSNILSAGGFEKSHLYYTTLEDSVVLEHLQHAEIALDQLAKTSQAVRIELQEYDASNGQYPDVSFCGRYSIEVSHGINKFNATIFCTEQELELYTTYMASELNANKLKDTIFDMSMIPESDCQSRLSNENSLANYKQDGHIVDWSIKQNFYLNL